jgi:hypothetical protein
MDGTTSSPASRPPSACRAGRLLRGAIEIAAGLAILVFFATTF